MAATNPPIIPFHSSGFVWVLFLLATQLNLGKTFLIGKILLKFDKMVFALFATFTLSTRI